MTFKYQDLIIGKYHRYKLILSLATTVDYGILVKNVIYIYELMCKNLFMTLTKL